MQFRMYVIGDQVRFKLYALHRADWTAGPSSSSAVGVSSRGVGNAAACWERKAVNNKSLVITGLGV